MDIATVRDYIIVILGILSIIITIGLLVAIIFIYIKVSKLVASINRKLFPVRQWLTSINAMLKGLDESFKEFKKQGG